MLLFFITFIEYSAIYIRFLFIWFHCNM